MGCALIKTGHAVILLCMGRGMHHFWLSTGAALLGTLTDYFVYMVFFRMNDTFPDSRNAHMGEEGILDGCWDGMAR